MSDFLVTDDTGEFFNFRQGHSTDDYTVLLYMNIEAEASFRITNVPLRDFGKLRRAHRYYLRESS